MASPGSGTWGRTWHQSARFRDGEAAGKALERLYLSVLSLESEVEREVRGHPKGKEQRCGGVRAGGRVCPVLGLEAWQERLDPDLGGSPSPPPGRCWGVMRSHFRGMSQIHSGCPVVVGSSGPGAWSDLLFGLRSVLSRCFAWCPHEHLAPVVSHPPAFHA